ncbi:hypothetical protein FRX31_007266, partial [Thalictrum thalictroides]
MKNTIIPLDGTYLQDYSMLETANFSARKGDIVIVLLDKNDLDVFIYSLLNGQFKRIRAQVTELSPVRVKNHLSIKVGGEAPPSS